MFIYKFVFERSSRSRKKTDMFVFVVVVESANDSREVKEKLPIRNVVDWAKRLTLTDLVNLSVDDLVANR